jgi:hypothetical protein
MRRPAPDSSCWLARIRTGADEPTPEQVPEAARDVVAHCTYGVDKNPLAAELCRVPLVEKRQRLAFAVSFQAQREERPCGRF